MRQSPRPRSSHLRAEALAWLADELAGEARLDVLRRPRRQPRTPTRRPTPATTLARAS